VSQGERCSGWTACSPASRVHVIVVKLDLDQAECIDMRAIRLSVALICILIGVRMASVPAGADDGFEQIFDGKSLDGWSGRPQFWSVRDGAITGETTEENPTDVNTFLIFNGDEVSDFELRLKVKILNGNSGVQYRSANMGNFVVHGYQADVDSTTAFLGDLYEEGGRGLLARAGHKVEIREDGSKVVVGETTALEEIAKAVQWQDWNDYRVIARGNHLVQDINGLRTVDVVDRDADRSAREGVLALQLHAGEPMRVQFKDIQLKRLR
jgi:hypothetical protein